MLFGDGARMRMLFLIVAVGLAGCSSEAEKAEERYRFLERRGATQEELCSTAREARDAYAKEQNAQKYDLFWATAYNDCN